MDDWSAHVTVMMGSDEELKDNYQCWMTNYLTGCTTCPECPGDDPFAD